MLVLFRVTRQQHDGPADVDISTEILFSYLNSKLLYPHRSFNSEQIPLEPTGKISFIKSHKYKLSKSEITSILLLLLGILGYHIDWQ